MDIVHQPRTLLVLGHNAGMDTAAGAEEQVEFPTDACAHPGPLLTVPDSVSEADLKAKQVI